MIWLNFGGELETREGHKAVRHNIKYEEDPKLAIEAGSCEVNSFHNHCLRVPSRSMQEQLFMFACADDGTIEGVRSRQGLVVGVMWHPEREEVPHSRDVALVHSVFGLKRKI